MQTIRRLYVYLMSGISLGVLAAGLIGLFSLLFSELGLTGGDPLFSGGGNPVAERLSLSAALTGVALPVWLLHWWLAERSLASANPAAESERRSIVRALYLSLVLLASVLWAVFSAGDLLRGVIARLLGEELFTPSPPSDSLAWTIVMGSIWLYHAWVRVRDLRAGPLRGAAAWLPRVYLYVVTGIGALVLLFGASELVNATVTAIFAAPALTGPDLPTGQLAGGITGVVVGSILWGAHWLYVLRFMAADDWRAASERDALLRRAYFAALMVFVAAWVVGQGVASLGSAVQALLGVPEAEGAELARAIIGPAVAALPFVAAWWLTDRWLRAEARRYGGAERLLSVERLSGYLLAAVGLLTAAGGAAWLLGILIDLMLGGARTISFTSEFWRGEAARAAAAVVVGAPLWLWNWYRAQRRHAADAPAESAATIRRVYLFAALGGALIAGLISLAILLYRGLNLLLQGSAAEGAASEVSSSLGVFIVAVAVFAYHGAALRRDLAVRRRLEPQPAPAVAPETPLVAGAEAAPSVAVVEPQAGGAAASASVSVVLSGPAGADLDGVLADLTGRLPEGYTLRPTAGERGPG